MFQCLECPSARSTCPCGPLTHPLSFQGIHTVFHHCPGPPIQLRWLPAFPTHSGQPWVQLPDLYRHQPSNLISLVFMHQEKPTVPFITIDHYIPLFVTFVGGNLTTGIRVTLSTRWTQFKLDAREYVGCSL